MWKINRLTGNVFSSYGNCSRAHAEKICLSESYSMKFRSKATALIVVLAMALGFAVASQAQVVIDDAWVRATVPNQQATGAFFRMTSKQDVTLVSARSDIAGVVEVHEMNMEQGVMKMRAVEKLRLPAGQTIEFKSGGYHLMLMDLKNQVKPNTETQISLVFEGPQGKRETVYVHAPVRMSAPTK